MLGGGAGESDAVARYREFLADGWHAGAITVGAQLWDAAGVERLERDYGRGFFDDDLPQGGATTVAVRLRAPGTPGRYRLRIDMVCEDACWFADDGGELLDLPLEVVSGPVAR